MKIDIITLFPKMFSGPFSESIISRAQKKKLIEIKIHNLRDFALDKHKTVDDKPYGGGVGMILKPDVLARTLKSILALQKTTNKTKAKIILMSASGTPFKQEKARKFSKLDHLIIICGHYESVDQRFIDKYIDEEISIGDYVLTGGEIPAMAIIDAIVRLIPKVLEKPQATQEESFTTNLLEFPQYTRPEEFEGLKVPDILLSGNHAEIEKWKKEKSLEKTKKLRPDLLQ